MRQLFLTSLFILAISSNAYCSALTGKADMEEDSIIKRIYDEIKGVNSKVSELKGQVDFLEQRFNESQQTTTTASTTTVYPGRWISAYNAGSYYTTTKSPQEVCKAAGNFLCYNETSICVNSTSICDGISDCPDESDELFCTPTAPENILEHPHKCPTGFFGSEKLQKCYKFSPVGSDANWIEALIECTKIKADLVSIDSRVEQEALVRFIKEKSEFSNSSIWLGATNILRKSTSSFYFTTPNSNMQWKWLSNNMKFSEVAYTNWIGPFRQQPDNTNKMEYCLEMRSDYQWQWNDMQCQSQNPYVCQVAMSTKVGGMSAL